MEISWFEIVAQIINFFVLLIILQYFFYKPITKAMADRKERILKAEKAADSKMSEAEELIKNYGSKIEGIESEKKSILANYRTEALEEKDSLLEEYEEEANSKRKKYREEVEEEKEYFIKGVRKELGRNAVQIASKILTTISSKELEDEVYKSFISDLVHIKENVPNKDILEESRNINLYSSKELSKGKKKEIELILKEHITNIEHVHYEINENLVLGYELNLETYTVHSSIKKYLDEVEENIIDVLESQNL